MEVKGAIFDLDGTLLDSMDVWEQIDIDFLAKRGFKVPDDYIEKVTPLGFKDAARYTIKQFNLSEAVDDIIEEWSNMAAYAYANTVPLKSGAKEYLIHLKQKGVGLSAATALNEALYKPALIHNGIYGLFDAFTTLDEVARRKGFPDIYFKAAEKINADVCSCIVFEDILEGVKGAKAGGFYTVGVFEPYSEYDKDKIIETADLYIKDFKEMFLK